MLKEHKKYTNMLNFLRIPKIYSLQPPRLVDMSLIGGMRASLSASLEALSAATPDQGPLLLRIFIAYRVGTRNINNGNVL